MVRMNSCRGHEFAPYFGARDLSGDESSGSESASVEEDDVDAVLRGRRGVGGEEGVEMDGFVAEEEFEDVDGAFADARDRWKIDGETLKGFYLHSPTRQLFGWNQARGVLYEYNRASGECIAVWAACQPQVNAELWTVLPLPPTDPASMQAAAASAVASPALGGGGSAVNSTGSSNVLCMLHLSRARAAERAHGFAADFCQRLGLDGRAMDALEELAPPGQAYVLRTFCAPGRDASGALRRQVRHLQALAPEKLPWAGCLEAATVRVPAAGAILGRCVPEIAALCWSDGDDVAAAHCRVAYVGGRFCVCDLGADEEGTWLCG
eukprot:CAMPEP_0203906572 /NCGR_PEP_ID=MMETSP0359-20131031/48167_1 /ASSEMBLY_ACC=CAM_ASM_000338 /TAXON_ID=268821 /ORGANISM="Scrippsiella Hangoei, Strain SHTV-5" /LENGTH=321 /DNA_ID=CAMNT_0050831227 /DNA_START=50 /DNA_END=1011 /DNA_ORIENTATION=+